MASNSGLISSLIHVFLSPLLCFISRLRMLGPSAKKDKDMILEREGGEKTELNFKFRFPAFEQGSGNSFNSEIKNKKFEFSSGRSPVSAFIQVLKTLPVREINGNNISSLSCNNEAFSSGRKLLKFDDDNVEIEAIEFQENKVDGFLDFCSEKKSDDFLKDGDFGQDLGTNGEENEVNNVKENNNNNFLSENDFNEDSDKKNDGGFVAKDEKWLKGGDYSEKLKEKEESLTVDSNELESLWEHQELIEQLQMELKKAKATGLPTILEESESPKIIDDLKPWKIRREDYMGEVHNFYKSYSEMMRKFDILNYQKMYAMGFVQLGDSFHSTSQQKPSPATLKSLVSRTLFKHKSHGSDPIKKFVDELQCDIEVVYVGQTCLSWEFLHWQYEKALDLWNSDPNGVHRYNEVAGEFQQFQVLVQRFTENEPFQGPRVQSYVKSRCVLRNLLQVPVIREDSLEEEKKGRGKEADEHVITSEMLVEIVEESIRIFWQFVRTEKDCSTSTLSGPKKIPDSEDQKLLQDVRKTLQKSEKKLKDILRSEKCILRKFRQSREEDCDQALQFFAQADIKLVNRVLNMSKISRDQLIWCQNKLSKISIFNRKVYREPAFLLFPS
ncbi:hypothetical protein ACS0TY_005881 [Phlomoides rotata]